MIEYIFSSLTGPGRERKQQAGGQPLLAGGGPSQFSAMSRELIAQMSRLNKFSNVHVPRLTFATLILSCVIVSLLLQCNEAKQLDFDLAREGKPCICNSTFFKFCPPADACLENNIPDATPPPKPADPRDNYLDREAWDYGALAPTTHDDYDPDHVSDPWQDIDREHFRVSDPWPNIDDHFRLNYNKPIDKKLDYHSEGRIARHRKVYIKPRASSSANVIHALNIRIPVKAPVIDEPVIPAPKPMYKMKKYITYERKPEIVQVPVTKTIIRPVGVDPDQIIQDDSPAGPVKLNQAYPTI